MILQLIEKYNISIKDFSFGKLLELNVDQEHF